MLINSITEIQEFIAIGKDTDFNRLKPHLVYAENAYIQPILGLSFLQEIQRFYNGLNEIPPVEETEEETAQRLATTEFLKTVQRAIIYLAYWSGFQVLNATISDSGFKRTETANSKSLFKYQEDDLRNYFKYNGYDALEKMLEILDVNIGQFDTFKESPYWSFRKTSFIPDTKTLSPIISFNNSRLTFLRLIPHFNLVEDFYILPLLGKTLYARIKAEMLSDSPDPELIKVVPYIQKPLAFLASALLMEESGADLMEKGLYFESASAISQNDRNINPADAQRIALLAKRNRGQGENYLENLKAFLLENAAIFPEFAGVAGNVFRRDNTNKKTFWA